MSSPTPLLSVVDVSKAFPPAVQALTEVDFTLLPGEVHALVGENGAGKSTLSRIIAGLTAPDSGTVSLKGKPYSPRTRREAEQNGVRMVMQELNQVPTLTVAESIFLDRLPHRLGWIDRKQLVQDARTVLERVGLGQLDTEALVGSLGIGQQQLVEIAAGLSVRCDVLILDEPTAALTNVEAELLFKQIAALKATGVGIIYISHRMEEIGRIADRVTVLRDGRVVGTANAGDLTPPEIIRMMVGRDVGELSSRAQAKPGAEVLRVEGLRSGFVRDVSFTLHAGEILGFAGLMGSGRTETMRAIFGADSRNAGSIHVRAEKSAATIESPRDAIHHGIALLTEDRKGEGLLLPWSIGRNVTLAFLDSVKGAAGWVGIAREKATAEEMVRRLHIRCSSVDQPVVELSGGNQQKVVIAKWLYRDCDVLIFDEPTRGIDVGAKFEIYEMLSDLARRGKGVIVVSSDLVELLSICDRIAVLSAGSLVRVFNRDEFNQDAIMAAALTHY